MYPSSLDSYSTRLLQNMIIDLSQIFHFSEMVINEVMSKTSALYLFPFGFRPGFGIEVALVMLIDNLHLQTDKGNVSLLLL